MFFWGACMIIMKARKKILIILVFVLGGYIFYSYGKVEYLTHKYKSNFEGKIDYAVHRAEDFTYTKVFGYSKNEAKILLGKSGYKVLLKLQKNSEGVWKVDEEMKSSSSSGTADDFIWPYYK